MRRRQPRVQRHHARFHAEPAQKQQKRRCFWAGCHSLADVAEAGKTKIPRRLIEQQEPQQQAAGAEVRHHEVKHTRLARLGFFVLEGDQAVGRKGHQLPRHQKEEGVVRSEHQGREEQQPVVESPQRPGVFAAVERLGVSERVDGNRQPQKRHHDPKKRPQRRERHREPGVRNHRGHQTHRVPRPRSRRQAEPKTRQPQKRRGRSEQERHLPRPLLPAPQHQPGGRPRHEQRQRRQHEIFRIEPQRTCPRARPRRQSRDGKTEGGKGPRHERPPMPGEPGRRRRRKASPEQTKPPPPRGGGTRLNLRCIGAAIRTTRASFPDGRRLQLPTPCRAGTSAPGHIGHPNYEPPGSQGQRSFVGP